MKNHGCGETSTAFWFRTKDWSHAGGGRFLNGVKKAAGAAASNPCVSCQTAETSVTKADSIEVFLHRDAYTTSIELLDFYNLQCFAHRINNAGIR